MSTGLYVFGEVLFDHLPDGKRVLGGAPFNVAWHLQAFGAHPLLISRVGNDSDGMDVKAAMQQWGMNSSGLQTDDSLPTGRVQVSIEDGEPSYDIVHPAAWDAIEVSEPPRPIRLLYHGSLALRSECSREAWKKLRSGIIETLFVDVNLRAPWFRHAHLEQAIAGAHWVKLNADELDLLAPGSGPARQRARSFVEAHELEGLVLTMGPEGAAVLLASGDILETRPAGKIAVRDTVGAGDALTAVMILGLVNGWPLQVTLDRAQAFASAITGRHGATVRDPEFYTDFASEWRLEPL